MSVQNSEQVQVAIARQTSRDTAVNTPQAWIPLTQPFDVKSQAKKKEIQETINSGSRSQGAETMYQQTEGSFPEMYLYPELIGWILTPLLGAPTTSDEGGGVYQHTWKIGADKLLPLVTILESRAGQADMNYKSCAFSSLKVMMKSGDYVKASANFLGGASAEISELTPTRPTRTRYVHYHTTFKLGASLASLSNVKVKELEYELTNGAYHDYTNTITPEDIIIGLLEGKGSFVLNRSDNTYRDLDYNNTARAIEILFSRDSKSVLFKLPQVTIDTERQTSMEEVETEKVNFTSHHDEGAGYHVEIAVTNETANYDAA